uniref:Uncharacterized protein n=1 Tax=Mycena chlorophos TaxID=658473 RepID=A0ABQ0M0N8_MYCCL|nr:predicted protein [Mycena chlorophos]
MSPQPIFTIGTAGAANPSQSYSADTLTIKMRQQYHKQRSASRRRLMHSRTSSWTHGSHKAHTSTGMRRPRTASGIRPERGPDDRQRVVISYLDIEAAQYEAELIEELLREEDVEMGPVASAEDDLSASAASATQIHEIGNGLARLNLD